MPATSPSRSLGSWPTPKLRGKDEFGMNFNKLRARHALLVGLACVLVTATSGSAAAAPGPVVIDDFTTGAYNLTIHANRDASMQQGSMASGVRCTLLDATVDPYNRESHLGLGTGRMFVETGVRVQHSMSLMYGWDKTCTADGKMDLDLSGLDRFRLDFDLLSLDLAGAMRVWSPQVDPVLAAPSASIAICGNGIAADVSFSCDMSFSAFEPDPSNPPNPVDWAHITYIMIFLQSAGTIMAHEYAMNSIKAINAPGAAAGQQRSTATNTTPPAPRPLPTIPRPSR